MGKNKSTPDLSQYNGVANITGSLDLAGPLSITGSLRVDNPGISPGTVGSQPSPDTVEGGVVAQGTPNIYLGSPDKWLTINIDGVDYNFPGYIKP